jgi:undecaprenyl-diphosphatase
MLTARYLGLTQTEFVKSFEIAIQLGAILAVMFLYRKPFLAGVDIYKKLLAAFVPTAVIGGLLYKFIKGFLLDNIAVVLWALFLGGIALIIFEYFHREKDTCVSELSAISLRQAFLIGAFQSIAVIPGVSRAAATIIGGLILGLRRKTIVEFSFLLAVPTMAAAVALDLFKSAHSFSAAEFGILGAGFIASFAVAVVSIRFLLFFIKKNDFTPFGIYRIILALVLWLGFK